MKLSPSHQPSQLTHHRHRMSCPGQAGLGVTRFDGHPRSGALAPGGCPSSWRPWERSRSRRRRSFTPEFKAEIVECCRRGDRSIGQVAKDFDLTETAVREWVKQADLDAGSRRDGLTSAERDELAALRRENRRLREDVEILKRATAFFAKRDPVNVYPFIEAEKAERTQRRPGVCAAGGLPFRLLRPPHRPVAAGPRRRRADRRDRGGARRVQRHLRVAAGARRTRRRRPPARP